MPILSVKSGTYDFFSTSDIYSVSFGSSSGLVSCVNTTRSNTSVTTIKSINALGVNTIECTATSNAGKSSTVSGNIIINTQVPISNLYVTGNGTKTENAIIINHGEIQFGPYYQANKGCYYITYKGTNLNTYPNGFVVSENETGYGNHYYSIKYLNYISTDANYFLYLDSNTKYNGLETAIYNDGNDTITVTNISIYYYGNNCQ